MTNPAIGGIRLVLGGNVFGWTADRDASFAVLDAFHAAGGRMIDTAAGYSAWVPGHKGGESESMIGDWLAARGHRDLLIATKVNMTGAEGGLAPDAVAASLDASLARLRTDNVALLYAHRDDAVTPQDEVAAGFDALVKAGKVRSIGVSNFTAARLGSALAAAAGATQWSAVQDEYNLVARTTYEGALQNAVVANDLAMFPFYGLAAGYLTGKYRSPADLDGARRGRQVMRHLDGHGPAVLAAMDSVAAETGARLSQIALAWLNAQPGIAAPIASATSVAQLDELVGATALALTPEQLARLDAA